jgi:hypothetical protein
MPEPRGVRIRQHESPLGLSLAAAWLAMTKGSAELSPQAFANALTPGQG